MNSRSIVAQASDDITLQGPDPLLATTLFQTLFWKPRFMTDSPVTVHVPLFYWLSCVLRPQRVCVIGANDGMAHFAFCQAIDRLELGGRCEAFGFWHDTKVGERVAPPPSHLKEHQEMLYDGLSELIPCLSLEEALLKIPLETVDLLFCDLTKLPEGTQITVDTLNGYLSKRGILLLHGTNKAKLDKPDICGVSGFGDTSFYISFPEGDGLSLMCSGGNLPAPLQSLFNMTADGLLRRDVEQVFRRSGQGLQATAAVATYAHALQSAEKIIISTQKTLQQTYKELQTLEESHDLSRASLLRMQREVFDLRRELEELPSPVETSAVESGTARHNGASAWQQKQAEIAAMISSAQAEAAAARDKLKAEQTIRFQETEALVRMSEELRNRLDLTEAALVERTKECDAACLEAEAARKAHEKAVAAQAKAEAALTSARASAEAAKAELQAERHTRFEETAILTKIAEDLHKELEFNAERHRKELQEVIKQKDQVQRYNQELLQSTSWKITAPMRSIKTKIGIISRRRG